MSDMLQLVGREGGLCVKRDLKVSLQRPRKRARPSRRNRERDVYRSRSKKASGAFGEESYWATEAINMHSSGVKTLVSGAFGHVYLAASGKGYLS